MNSEEGEKKNVQGGRGWGMGGCLLCCVRTISIFEAKPGEALTLQQDVEV